MYSRGDMGGSDSYNGSSKRRRWYDSDSYYGGGYAYGGGGYMGQPPLPVVRLRGLPYNCTESDVQEFFAGLNVVDVLMVHKQGRFSGEAYVVFGMHTEVDYALQRNRQNMGRRYVEVFRCNRKEYYGAISAEVSDTKTYNDDRDVRVKPVPSATVLPEREDEEHTGVLRLRGLPFSVSKQDITEFFSEFGVTEDNIHILTLPEGRATGEAFVEFEGPDESKAAMKKDKMMIGSRYVELFVSSREEATKAAARYK